MSGKATFSRSVKNELSQLPCSGACCQRAEVAAAFYGAGQFSPEGLSLATGHVAGAARLAALIQSRFHCAPGWQAGRELIVLSVTQPDICMELMGDMAAFFGSHTATLPDALRQLPDCCRQAMLRAVFLACGSISEPSAAYHLELALRRPEAAEMAVGLLETFAIRPGRVERHGHLVIYLKEGQHIADFLLLTGAHRSLLNFESLRVDKEMRNSVNRMVNCDSANTQRIANTAARQLELIRALNETGGLSRLPEDLRLTAEVRLENPDLSIKELGEIMLPPLGKSGMNHRLKRLEAAAADWLAAGKGGTDGS